MYLDIFNNSLSDHKEIAESINQFLNVSPEPDLIIEEEVKDYEVVEAESNDELNDSDYPHFAQDCIEKQRTTDLENQRGWWF